MLKKRSFKAFAVLLVAVFSLLMSSTTTAFAYVDPEAESGKGEYTEEGVIIYEPMPTETPAGPEQPFTTKGNGDLGDEITSGMKDFYTIHTKNNNTFYLVIDHAGSTDNVYMLSLIDEDDLAEFLEEGAKQDTKPTVVVPETTPDPKPVEVTPEPETKQTTNSSLSTIIILAVVGAAALIYYFKVMKPKKEETVQSEGMETGDGLATENEDASNGE